MTDTPVLHEPTSPTGLARCAEITGVTGAVEITERAEALGTAEAVPPPAEDDLVIEDLSDAAWPFTAPGICICTVGAE